MKKVKLSLANMIGKLTRNEMRYVMAGSGGRSIGVCEQVWNNAYFHRRGQGFSYEYSSWNADNQERACRVDWGEY